MLSVLVLTAMGTVFAFKARNLNASYCTKNSSGKCSSYVIASKEVLAPNGVLVWAIYTTDTGNCTKLNTVDCTYQLRLEAD